MLQEQVVALRKALEVCLMFSLRNYGQNSHHCYRPEKTPIEPTVVRFSFRISEGLVHWWLEDMRPNGSAMKRKTRD